MEIPSARSLIDRLRRLSAVAELLDRIGDMPGVYLVGGGVRDLLLGGHPHDLDLVVEGDPGALIDRLGGERRVHDRFGTSTAWVGAFTYDIARARSETYSRPGALPDVFAAGLRDDLRRRDFTVNAMAIALGGPAAGELIAVPSAVADLEQRRLRVLHDRSFIDDPTRLLRLARYAGRLGFELEPHTAELAAQAIAGDALATVSGPRIGAELRLLAREPRVLEGFHELRRLELDRAIHPGFMIVDYERVRRALALLPADGRQDLLVLAAAAEGIDAAELRSLLDRLAFGAGERDRIVAAADRARTLAASLSRAGAPSEIAQAAEAAPAELVALAGARGPAEPARRWLSELRHVELEIDGDDLRAGGVPEGPRIGLGLRAALAAKLDGRAPDRDAELEHALRAARSTG